jgi:hypothetical protein
MCDDFKLPIIPTGAERGEASWIREPGGKEHRALSITGSSRLLPLQNGLAW